MFLKSKGIDPSKGAGLELRSEGKFGHKKCKTSMLEIGSPAEMGGRMAQWKVNFTLVRLVMTKNRQKNCLE